MPESLIIEREGLIWHHFDDPEDPELIVLAASYSLHELALEDCNTAHSRAKLDDYGDYLFAVLNAPKFLPASDRLIEERLCVFVSDEFIVTVCDGTHQAIGHAQAIIKSTSIYNSAKDIFYLLMDHTCDQFLPTIDDISEDIAELEMIVYEKPDKSISRRATALKRILTFVRRGAVGHREIINQLLRKHPPFVDARLNLYFRDIYDHLVQATDLIETDRDLLTGIIDINLSATAHRTNEIVKTLTIFATALLPLNVVTGYFGMNFAGLPFVHDRLGVPVISLLLVAMVAGSAFYFRRREW